jgi:hypothetical protein
MGLEYRFLPESIRMLESRNGIHVVDYQDIRIKRIPILIIIDNNSM